MRNCLVMAFAWCLLVSSLVILGSSACQIVSKLDSGFVMLVDVLSKIATVGVFVWAVYVYLLNEKRRGEDELNRYVIDLSFQIEEMVKEKKYISRRGMFRVLIRKLEEITKSCGLLNSEGSKKRLMLTLDVVWEQVKDVSLSDIFNKKISGGGGYKENLDFLKEVYSDKEMIKFVDERYGRYIEEKIENMEPVGSCDIFPPRWTIQLSDIEELLSLVRKLDGCEIKKRLVEDPELLVGIGHHAPAIFAFYRFYRKGKISINNDFKITVFGV